MAQRHSENPATMAFFGEYVHDLTVMAVANYTEDALHGRHVIVRALFNSLPTAFDTQESAWLFASYVNACMFILDDLAAAIHAGRVGSLAAFGPRFTSSRHAEASSVFEACLGEGMDEDDLARALGLPEPGAWRRTCLGATDDDLRILMDIRNHAVRHARWGLRRIARAWKKFDLLHNKLKHSAASVVLMQAPSTADSPYMLVAIEHVPGRPDATVSYPVRRAVADTLGALVEDATALTQMILQARRFQMMLKEEHALPPHLPAADEKIASAYQELLHRHYDGHESTEIKVRVNVAGIWSDDPWLADNTDELLSVLGSDEWPTPPDDAPQGAGPDNGVR